MQKLKVLSLFGGIECGRMALENIGIPIESYHSSEFDPYPIKASSHNFPDIIHIGDVTKVDGTQYEGIDLLIGGPPCQDLSIAGKRAGLSGKKSSHFYDFTRILRDAKPRAFMVENVASMPKEAKEEMIRELYGIDPVMINSTLVSAQNRKRFYWAGVRNSDGGYDPVIIDQPMDREIYLRDILEDIPMDDPRWRPLREEFVGKIKEREKGFAVTATYAGACPQDHIRSNRTVITGIFQRPRGENDGGVVQDGDKSPNVNASKFQDNNLLVGRFRGTDLRIHVDQEKSQTLTSQMGTGGNNMPVLIDPAYYWRKLTVRECARLQTIPETYDFSPLSDSRAYKGVGNGWTVDVIEHILRKILVEIGYERSLLLDGYTF